MSIDAAKLLILLILYYLLLKYRRGQYTLLSPAWVKSLTKFNTEMYVFKRVLDLNCE